MASSTSRLYHGTIFPCIRFLKGHNMNFQALGDFCSAKGNFHSGCAYSSLSLPFKSTPSSLRSLYPEYLPFRASNFSPSFHGFVTGGNADESSLEAYIFRFGSRTLATLVIPIIFLLYPGYERRSARCEFVDRESFQSKKMAPHFVPYIKHECGMQYRDLVVGLGEEVVEEGDTVSVHYEGLSSKSGRVVENTLQGRIFPVEFVVGRKESTIDITAKYVFILKSCSCIIEAIDYGVRGMKKGGKRQLIVPPNLAYEGIVDEVLIYEVDLVQIVKSGSDELPPGIIKRLLRKFGAN